MALGVEIKKMVLNFTDDKRVKYVATANRGKVVDPEALVNQIHLHSGTNKAQIRSVISQLVDAMSVYLNEGHGVRLDGFGTFVPSVRSQSSDNPEEAGIKKVKITFLPNKALREMVANIGIYTENEFTRAGSEEEGGGTNPGGGGNGGGGGELG